MMVTPRTPWEAKRMGLLGGKEPPPEPVKPVVSTEVITKTSKKKSKK